MEDTVVKLPDLVRSTNDPECGEDTVLNAVTQTEEMPLNTDTVQTPTLDTPILTSDDEFNGVPDSTTVNPANEQVTPLNTGDRSENGTMDPANEHVTPLNTDDKSENGNTVNNKTDSVDTSTDQHPESWPNTSSHPETEPIGHDTCTTTDEEEAVEALLALSVLPDNRTEHNDLYENEELMLIRSPNAGVDVNPVEIKLSANDVEKAIEDLPYKSKLKPVTPPTSTAEPDKTPNNSSKNTTPEGSPPSSTPTLPTTDKLKVTRYGLSKTHHKKRSYKCQKCGKRENSVHDLNEHHRVSHPPLLCTDCNKVFNVPSTFQLHLYEHQKKNIVCETCGQSFSFKGQLEQHKIIHHTIKTHKCMAKGCDWWFMHKVDLTVHAATHDKVKYKCDKCVSFSTNLKKYWKEHMKIHEDTLLYACSICKKGFLYCQQVSRY